MGLELIFMVWVVKYVGGVFNGNIAQSKIEWNDETEILPFINYTISVNVKNNLGIITDIGDNMYLDIRNKCSWTSDFECTDDITSPNNLTSIQLLKMTSFNNGSYSIGFSIETEGEISLAIIGLETSIVKTEFFDDYNFNPSTVISSINTLNGEGMNYNWGPSGILGSTCTDNCSVIFNSIMVPPNFGDINFEFTYDDAAKLYLNEELIVEGHLDGPKTFMKEMKQDNAYWFNIRFQEHEFDSFLALKYHQGSTFTDIATNLFSFPHNFGSKQVTSKCADGYYLDLSQSTSECLKTPISNLKKEGEEIGSISSGLIACGMALSTISTITSGGSSQSIFSAVNQFQLLLLFPLFKFYLPDLVKGFYQNLDWTLFSFDFINSEGIPGFSKIEEELGEEQRNEALKIIGIEETSSILNTLSISVLIIAIVGIHFVLSCVYLKVRDKEGKGCIGGIVEKVWGNLTFNFYIRSVSETMMVVVISCFSEIYAMEMEGSKMISFVFSCMTVVFMVFFLLFVFVFWKKNYEVESDSISPHFREIFNGLKDKKYARFYLIANCGRKFLLCFILLIFPFLNNYLRVALFSIVQLIFTLYITLALPFDLQRDNIREVLNEIMITVYSLAFFHLNKKSSWNDTFANLYIYISLTNVCIGSVIAFVCLFIDLKQKCSKTVKSLPVQIRQMPSNLNITRNEEAPSNVQIMKKPQIQKYTPNEIQVERAQPREKPSPRTLERKYGYNFFYFK